MRLIDADELRKCVIPCEIHNGASTDLCVPLYQIDNAPAVELKRVKNELNNELKRVKNELNNELKRVKNELNNELNELRPQGKWKWIVKSTNIQLDPDCIMCSNCKFMFNNATPYCPNCGADMRGDNNG